MRLNPGEFKTYIYCPACGIGHATIAAIEKNAKGEERVVGRVPGDLRVMAQHRKTIHGEMSKTGRPLSAKKILEHRRDP